MVDPILSQDQEFGVNGGDDETENTEITQIRRRATLQTLVVMSHEARPTLELWSLQDETREVARCTHLYDIALFVFISG